MIKAAIATFRESNLLKCVVIAGAVFTMQQVHSANSSADTATPEELHKASNSCQTWSKQGYRDLMNC